MDGPAGNFPRSSRTRSASVIGGGGGKMGVGFTIGDDEAEGGAYRSVRPCSPPRAGSGSDTSVIIVVGVFGRSPPKTSVGFGIAGREGKVVGSERLNSESKGIGKGVTV